MATKHESENAGSVELEQGTPQPEKIEVETAKRTTKEVNVDYMGKEEARPYSSAITDEHRAVLDAAGIPITD